MNDQLSLMPEKANARRGDPWTSHAAARSVEPTLRRSQAAVLECFNESGPMDHGSMVFAYNYARAGRGWPRQSESGLRTRTRELVTAGLLRDSGRTVLLPSGRSSIVWEPQTSKERESCEKESQP